MHYKTSPARGFFDAAFRLEKLKEQNDPLVKLKERIDFELFRPPLEQAFFKEDKGIGGARPYDYVMMFKILILQRYYNIGDDKLEFAILDRLSFMRFLGLSLNDSVPDAKTIWLFRETLTQKNLAEKLFELFWEELKKKGLLLNEGKIPDAWKEQANKVSHKDTDARWTKKNVKVITATKTTSKPTPKANSSKPTKLPMRACTIHNQ